MRVAWVGLLLGMLSADSAATGGCATRTPTSMTPAAPSSPRTGPWGDQLDDDPLPGEAQPEHEAIEPGTPLRPLPARIAVDPGRAQLGEQLFHDTRLSSDNTVSCASCHPLNRAGVDGVAHSHGASDSTTAVNTPTVFNCAFNVRYNWNGAYDTLEAELDAPVRRAMRTEWRDLVARVAAVAMYREAFARRYPDGVTEANVRNALAEFERTLVTPNSRFDRFLRGDASALTTAEQRGYALFRDRGCSSCHQGANVGGNMFQRMGVMGDYFRRRPETPGDQGRFAATHDPEDRHVFRVPSLRNVARTAPYLHDGSAETLEDVIATMADYQLGEPLRPDEIADIAKFLRTLTGEFRGRPL